MIVDQGPSSFRDRRRLGFNPYGVCASSRLRTGASPNDNCRPQAVAHSFFANDLLALSCGRPETSITGVVLSRPSGDEWYQRLKGLTKAP
jgi:hypothetical protein